MPPDYVTWKDMNDIIDKTSKKTTDQVTAILGPQLENIHYRINNHQEHDKKIEMEVERIKLICAARGARCPHQAAPEALPRPSTSDRSQASEDSDDEIDAETIKKKTAVIIAIVTAVFMIGGTLLTLFLWLLGLIPL